MEFPTAPADEADVSTVNGQPHHSSYEQIDNSEVEPGLSRYEARIRTALQELREEIQEKETTLNRLRGSSESLFREPSADSVNRLHQLRIIKTAFELLTPTEPQLPSPDSPLPMLLTLRTSQHTIDGTKSSIMDLERKLVNTRKRLKKEESDLHDAKLITAALERRISSLQQSQSEGLQQPSDNSVNDFLETIQKKRMTYEREVKRLVKAFNRFIDNHLTAMLVAEDEGGPVVGGATEKDWGKFGKTSSKDAKESKSMAAEELRTLSEDLLNASVSSGRNRSGAYVNLARDSAASRFLVRAKVAEFSPRDASRIRLIDFGRRLDN